MAKTYLLELEENVGDDYFITNHLVEAEDRQKVKYHFHRTLKDWGYRDSRFDKHYLTRDRLGAEINRIIELSQVEVEVLERYLNYWAKV